MLITCREGKDGTGFVCTLLLVAVGVGPDERLADQLRSDAHFDRAGVAAVLRAHLDPDAPAVADAVLDALRVREECLLRALDTIDERYGSVERYVATVGGIDDGRRRRLRALVLDAV